MVVTEASVQSMVLDVRRPAVVEVGWDGVEACMWRPAGMDSLAAGVHINWYRLGQYPSVGSIKSAHRLQIPHSRLRSRAATNKQWDGHVIE